MDPGTNGAAAATPWATPLLHGVGRGEEATGGPGPVGTVHSTNCLNIF
jgi:hypothetical protein